MLVAACSGGGGGGGDAGPGADNGNGGDGGNGGPPGSGTTVNTTPLAAADIGVQSGDSLTLPVLLNDSDPDGDPLVISTVTEPAHGSATTVGDRIVYTPEAGFLGADTFSYTINDGRGGTASATVRISAGLNAPRLTPDTATVAPTASVTIAVLANDIDLSGGSLRLMGVDQPANGSVSISENGTTSDTSDDVVVYTAPAGFAGTEKFSYSAANDAGLAMSDIVVTVTDPATIAPPVTVSGRAVKGPLLGATVSLYLLDERGQPQQPAVATTVTDTAGHWTAVVPADHGPLLIVTDGGEFADEASSSPGGRIIAFAPGDTLTGVLPAGGSEATVSVFSDALYRKSLFETQGENFPAVFAGNRADATAAFGFDPVATVAADPANPEPGMSEDALRYALALGGAANIINEMAVAVGLGTPNYAIIDAFIDDFAECVLNGEGLDGPLQVNVNGTDVDLPTQLNINLAIVRFRNNLADRYGTLLTQIDEDTCSRPGFLPDAKAPAFSAAPGPVTVNAQSAAGTPASDLAIDTLLNAPQASDDRDGPVPVSNDAPTLFPLGTTPVTFAATDASGNRAELVVDITVADLAPPLLTVPADVSVPQVGRVTAVPLGTASATDNVSASGSIVVFNDAPASGFPPGTTTVTWTAIDEAGLAGTEIQLVTVVSGGAPSLVTPLPDVAGTEDVLLNLDLAAAFDMPGTIPPIYTIAGLPAGSGLLLDASTGILRGQPNDADVLAAPLTLVFTADNGAGTASDTFVLSVTNVNDAPVIGSVPPTAAALGSVYNYTLTATDADPGDRLVVQAPTLPAWLSFNDNRDGTATLSGSPSAGDAGANAVLLEVSDDAGAVTSQSFSILVTGTADLSLSIVVDDATPAPGDIVTFTLTAANAGPDDADGVLITAFEATGYHLLSASGAF
ncbi:MAG: Ig-like domain-containing protein, partial [Pseudomonadota bacterium]